MSESLDNVRVVVRVRPFSDKEQCEGSARKCVNVLAQSGLIVDVKPEPKRFTYDYVADETSSQEEIFGIVGRPISMSCLSGYNGTIFAYGQTGAGKTFTIQGPSFDPAKDLDSKSEYRGLLPRCYEFIFDCIDEMSQSGVEFLVRCSYLEIYQEQIIDLMNPESRNLNVREDIKRGVYVEGLIEETVVNSADTFELLKIGARNRHVSSTSMNLESSRSHSVFTMLIESRQTEEGLVNFKSSRFHLIDLAGSERQKLTDAAGDRIKEAGMINKSLSALGNVINSLVDISEGRTRHVHYRDSKLTFLLKDSLGGNSKTCIVAAVSPALVYLTETMSTLKFAQRAKLIKNRAVVNEDTSGTIGILKEEVRRLKEEVGRHKQISSLASSQCPRCSGEVEGSTSPQVEGRVLQLEMLLDHNLRLRLDNEAKYMHEAEQKASLLQSQEAALACYEKKVSNGKMVVKFRDSTIARLQGTKPMDTNEEMEELRQELKMLKEQLEFNPAAAKLFAENEKLKLEIEELKEDKAPSAKAKLKDADDFTRKLADALKESVNDQEKAKEVLDEVARYRCGDTIPSPVKAKFRNELESNQLELELKLEILQDELARLQNDKDSTQAKLTHKLELQARRIEELSIDKERLEFEVEALRQVTSQEQAEMVDQVIQSCLETVEIGLSPYKGSTFEVSSSPLQPRIGLASMRSPTSFSGEQDIFMTPLQSRREYIGSAFSLSPIETFVELHEQASSPIRALREQANSPIKLPKDCEPATPPRQECVEAWSSPVKFITSSIALSPPPTAVEVDETLSRTEAAYAEMMTLCEQLKEDLLSETTKRVNLEAEVNEQRRAYTKLDETHASNILTLEERLKSSRCFTEELQRHANYLENELETIAQAHDYAHLQAAEQQKINREIQGQNSMLKQALQLAEERLQNEREVSQVSEGDCTNLNEALRQEEARADRFKVALDEAEGQRDKLVAELSRAIAKETETANALSEVKRDNERLSQSLLSAKSEDSERLEIEVQQLKDKLEAVKEDYCDLDDTLSQRDRELTRMQTDLNKTKAEIQAISLQLGEAQAALKEERDKRQQTEANKQEQQANLLYLQNELADFREKLDQSTKDAMQLVMLEATAAQKNNQLAQMEKSLKHLESELDQCKEDKHKLSQTNAKLTETLEKHGDKFKRLGEQHENTMVRLEFLSEELMTTRRNYEQAQQHNTSLEAKTNQLLAEISCLKDAQAKHSQFTTQLNRESASSIEELKENLEAAREEARILREENKTKMEILQNTNRSVLNTRCEIEKWKKCIDDNTQTITELRKELKDKTEQLEGLQAELTLTSTQSKTENELDYLRYVLQVKENELSELKEKGQLYYTQADEAIEGQQNEINALTKKLSALQSEATGLKEQLKGALADRDLLLNEFKRLSSAERIEDVRGLLGQMRDIRTKLYSSDSTRTKAKHNSQDDASYLRVQNQHLAEELKRRIEQIDTLHKTIQELKRGRDGGDDLQVRKQIVKQYDEIKGLTEGLTRIADFVFSLPMVSFNPEETSIIESTIKGINSLHDALQAKVAELTAKNSKLRILEAELLHCKQRPDRQLPINPANPSYTRSYVNPVSRYHALLDASARPGELMDIKEKAKVPARYVDRERP